MKTEHLNITGCLSRFPIVCAQRIEHLALLKRRAEQAESSGNLQVSVEDLVRNRPFLVAMSCGHNQSTKTQSPSMNEAGDEDRVRVCAHHLACRCHCPGGRRGVWPVRDERGCSSGY
ncbi:hypothetical protein EFE38_00010 [Escherichia coli O157:H7]|nr:hypothetical protein EFE38_00010 [Escherichia coli O157:H7]